MELVEDKRKLHALRKHIDDLLQAGGEITSRDPLTLRCKGRLLTVKHGMLVSYYDYLDLVAPIRDHQWPESLRQMAIEMAIKQLDEAIALIEAEEHRGTA